MNCNCRRTDPIEPEDLRKSGRAIHLISLSECRTMLQTIFMTLVILGMTIFASGCGRLLDSGVKPLRIAYYQGSVQSQIMAEAMRQILTNAGYEAKLVETAGYQDMVAGLMGDTLDLYTDYTSRIWMETLDHRSIFKPTMLPALKEELQEQGAFWQPFPHITGTHTVAVHNNIAEDNGLETMSQLADLSSSLKLGASRDFLSRQDGYPLLQQGYDMNFSGTRELPENIQYEKISDRSIDVMPISSIDGRLLMGRMVILEDDQFVLPHFTAGAVIREQIVREYPELPADLYSEMRNVYGKDLQEVSAMVMQNGTSVPSAAAYMIGLAEGEYIEEGDTSRAQKQ